MSPLLQRTRLFVERKLVPWPEFLAALVVGSVATSEARPDSDVDCIFVFDRFDERIVPAEFVWDSESDVISTIFVVDANTSRAVQIDAGGKRVVLADFLANEWEDGLKHELSNAIVLFDRDGTVAPHIAAKLRYSAELQAERVTRHIAKIEHSLASWRLESWITRGGFVSAHEQLTAAFEELLQLLHASNRVWLPWRYRWLISALKLPWLPDDFAARAQQAYGTGALTATDLWRRHATLRDLFRDVQDNLRSDVDVDDIFARLHPELGYAHNMDAWKVAHRELLSERARSPT